MICSLYIIFYIAIICRSTSCLYALLRHICTYTITFLNIARFSSLLSCLFPIWLEFFSYFATFTPIYLLPLNFQLELPPYFATSAPIYLLLINFRLEPFPCFATFAPIFLLLINFRLEYLSYFPSFAPIFLLLINFRLEHLPLFRHFCSYSHAGIIKTHLTMRFFVLPLSLSLYYSASNLAPISPA